MKKEKIKKIGKKIVSYIVVFIIMLAIFCIAMIATYALPNERIRGHINESKNLILTPNSNPILGNYVQGARMDEATDLLILNTAMNKGKTEDENVFISAFENSRYEEKGKDAFYALQQTMENDEIHNNEEYSRYWHGIQTIIRPLLLFFNYEEIRYLFMVIMFMALGIAIWKISKNLTILHGMAFLFAMLAVCFFIIPISLQYIGVFAIMILSMIVVSILYEKHKENLYPYLFFILGGLATFFDLLTVPIITLGLPLTLLILLKNKETFDLKKSILEMIKLSILWGIGYIMIFVSKWVIASIVLQKDAITVAIHQIFFRVNGSEEYPATRLGAIIENLKIIYSTVLFVLCAMITITWIIMFIKRRKSIKDMKVIIPLLLVALYPYIWYFIFAGHSTIHSYFTYRSQAITIFAILCAMIETIKINKPKQIKEEK